MRILHLTECYAGGVSRAINSIAENFEAEHHLLYAGGDIPSGSFTSTHNFPKSVLSRILAFNRAVRDLRPDVVHAHSSWAGLYTRVMPSRTPVVYEPHCFVFDDPQRPKILKFAYRTMESLLSFNSTVTVALTTHELELAKGLRAGQSVMLLSNIPTVTPTDLEEVRPQSPQYSGDHKFTVSMVGRIAPQKDPDFFAQVAKIANSAGQDWRFRWIGGSDDIRDEEKLSGMGVEVTGWLDKPSLITALRTSSLYLHSASYEGFPLSVLDAAALDLPIIVRDIACFDGFDLEKAASAEAAYESLKAAAQSEIVISNLRDKSRLLAENMSVDKQRLELQSIYGEALS